MLSGQDQEEDILVSSGKRLCWMIAPEAGPRCNPLICVLTGCRVLSYARVGGGGGSKARWPGGATDLRGRPPTWTLTYKVAVTDRVSGPTPL